MRYPASSAAADAQGVGAHKDTDILTLLLQDEVGGLEVETDHGWIAVPPLQGAFVINIGEILNWPPMGICAPMCTVWSLHKPARPLLHCLLLGTAFE